MRAEGTRQRREREREEAKQKQGVGKYGGGRRREPVAMAVIRLPT